MKCYSVELENGRRIKVVDIYAENEDEARIKAIEEYNLPVHAVRG